MISKSRKVVVAGCSVALLGFITAFVLRIAGAGHGALLMCYSLAFLGFAVTLVALVKEKEWQKQEGTDSQQKDSDD